MEVDRLNVAIVAIRKIEVVDSLGMLHTDLIVVEVNFKRNSNILAMVFIFSSVKVERKENHLVVDFMLGTHIGGNQLNVLIYLMHRAQWCRLYNMRGYNRYMK